MNIVVPIIAMFLLLAMAMTAGVLILRLSESSPEDIPQQIIGARNGALLLVSLGAGHLVLLCFIHLARSTTDDVGSNAGLWEPYGLSILGVAISLIICIASLTYTCCEFLFRKGTPGLKPLLAAMYTTAAVIALSGLIVQEWGFVVLPDRLDHTLSIKSLKKRASIRAGNFKHAE